MTLASLERLLFGGLCMLAFVLGSTILGWIVLKLNNAFRPNSFQDVFLTKCFWLGVVVAAVILLILLVADSIGGFIVGG